MQSRNNGRNINYDNNNNNKSNNNGGHRSGGSGRSDNSKPAPGKGAPSDPPVAMLKRIVAGANPQNPATITANDGKKPAESSKRTIAVNDLFGKDKGDAKEGGGSAATSTNPKQIKDRYEYGVVLSLRAAFGFIQSIYTEDSYYFSEKDFYHDIRQGDLVAFEVRQGPKGLAAFHVRLLFPATTATSSSPPTLPTLVTDVKGTIHRSHDRHRSNYGLIEYDSTSLSAVPTTTLSDERKQLIQSRYQGTLPFHHSAILRDTVPKNHFLDRGDYVQFNVITFPDTHFFIAFNIRFLQLKRDRAIALQIERMLGAGAVRELGVVSAVKNQEYGFIRGQDRKEELYFRIDDVENESNQDVKEGTEVEFFVIAEMIRGRLCERAIHLKIIPAGTVQFEVVVKSKADLTVLAEPGLPPSDEIPGEGKLDEDIEVEQFTGTKGMKIRTVDLWHRCMPDDLLVRKGDRLVINIHYYRPEKIFFARDVRVSQFFPLGRDIGQIVTIKEQQSFGFIKSDMRKVDLYFKSTQVMRENGVEVVPEIELKKGNIVTFDCSVEDALKLRAVRVQLADPATQQRYLSQVNPSSSSSSSSIDDTILLKDVVGVVVRSASKRDSQGLIKVAHQIYKEIQDLNFIDPLIVEALENHFLRLDSLPSIDLPGLPDYQKKLYQDVIDAKFSSQLAYETLPTHMTDNFKTLRITKKTEKDDKSSLKDSNNNGNAAPTRILTKGGGGGGDNTIPFSKEDYKTEELGPLINDMEVIFDVAFDRFKGKKVARNIRLTDEEIPQLEEEKNVGIIDAFIQGSYRGGFIRSIKNDEKLFWISSSNVNGKADNNGEEGGGAGITSSGEYAVDNEVSYELRKRGGLRCAVNVQVLPKGTLSKEVVLPKTCTAVITAHNTTTNQYNVVLADNVGEPQLALKYVDVKLLETLFAAQQPNQSTAGGTSTASTSTPVGETSTPQTNESTSKAESPEGEGQGESQSNVEGGSAVGGSETANAVSSEDRVEYKAKYYPPLPRLPFSIPDSGKTDVKVGDVINCQVVVNWALKRSPISVNILDIQSTPAVRRRGRIQNLKFRVKGNVINQVIAASSSSSSLSVDQMRRYRLNDMDWTEIQEISMEKKTGATPLEDSLSLTVKPAPAPAPVLGTFYCLFNEIMDHSGGELNRESLEVGEEVEFWSLPNVDHVAFGVVTLPKRDFGFGKGAPIIADRQKTKVAAPTNVIIMAQGPPADSAPGFEAGWRSIDTASIAALPWASLLPHLQA